MTNALTFDPQKVAASLIAGLSARSKRVIRKRFGLDAKKAMTLEAIGRIYGITRERVRQIEEVAVRTVKKADIFKRAEPYFNELKTVMENYGGVVHEKEFLSHLSADPVFQNNVHFLLVLGDAFAKLREDDFFHRRWAVDQQLADLVHESIKKLVKGLSQDDLLSEQEIMTAFMNNLVEGVREEHARQNAQRWLKLSKEIGVGPTGEWGLRSSPNVKVRGIRDYAYLVLRRHGSPLHFSEVAKGITRNFGVKANAATTHNELIKDSRFVLVGRGIYALTGWGYARGTVREVIADILAKNGPLNKEEIMNRVLKERHVKEGTVLVNLKDKRYFKQTADGKFVLQSK